MSTNEELLRLFAEHRDEGAFAEIVERHAGLVLGVARRRLQDAEAARDVAQQVFALLAAKAASLHRDGSRRLAGWLHRTALLLAGNALRSARRRNLYHEAFAGEMKIEQEALPPEEAPWREALPLVDAAIDSLSAADREVVLGHYFQCRAFRDLAASAGKSDHAMQKRASRALDKLSAFLRRRGIVISGVALAAGLSARTAEATPADFAGATAAASVKLASGLSTATLFANTLATMSLTKLTVAAAAIAFLLPLGWQWRQNSHTAPHPARAAGVNGQRIAGSAPFTTRPAVQNPIAPAAAQKSPLGILAGEIAKLDATNDQAQFLRVKRLILELPAEELRDAFDLVKGVRHADALDLSRAVFGRWGEVAPLDGLEVAGMPSTVAWREAKLAESGSPAMPTLGLFETWALRDPLAALAAAQKWDAVQGPRDDRHPQETPEMLAGLAVRDPVQALQLAATLPDASMRETAILRSRRIWALQEPEAAMRWVSENASDETRARDLGFMLRSISASHPLLAFNQALTFENPFARAEAIDFTLINWAPDQPGAALNAMLSLPDETMTPALVRHAAVILAGTDPAGMAQAAERLPQGERRDIFVDIVAHTWVGEDGAACLRWLENVAVSEGTRRKIQTAINQP